MVFYSCSYKWQTVFFDGVPDPATYTVFSTDSTNINGIVKNSSAEDYLIQWLQIRIVKSIPQYSQIETLDF